MVVAAAAAAAARLCIADQMIMYKESMTRHIRLEPRLLYFLVFMRARQLGANNGRHSGVGRVNIVC